MYRIIKASVLRTAFSQLFTRNLSVIQSTKSISDNVVFINNTKDSNELEFKFTYKWNNKIKSIGFVRPVENTVAESFTRMIEKLKRKTKSDEENYEFSLIDPKNGCSLSTETWKELIPILSTLRLQLNDNEYQIAYNYPMIESIELPKVAVVGFELYPSQMKYTGDMKNCKFKWFRSSTKEKWNQCGNDSPVYHCNNEDFGGRLKLVCELHFNGIITSTVQSNISNVSIFTIDTSAIDSRVQYTMKNLPENQFRVVSYNLLADFYAKTQYSIENLFYYCDPDYLNNDFRKKLHQKELFGYKSDFYCLQEVDEDFFNHDLTLTFQRAQMDGVYRKKFKTKEGLAIFYNSKKYR